MAVEPIDRVDVEAFTRGLEVLAPEASVLRRFEEGRLEMAGARDAAATRLVVDVAALTLVGPYVEVTEDCKGLADEVRVLFAA